MADVNADDNKFVEIDGKKFIEDPDKEGEALKDNDGNPTPFVEPTEDDDDKDKGGGDDDDDDGDSDDDKDKDKDKNKKPKVDDDDGDPPVRKSPKDFIIARKIKKIKELEKKKAAGEGNDDDADDGAGADDAPDVHQAIQDSLKPFAKNLVDQAGEVDLKAVLSKFGDTAKGLEKQVRKYMQHSAYAQVPVELIFLGLAAKKFGLGKDVQKVEADEKAAKDKLGGHQRRKTETPGKIPDVRDMTDKQVDELAQKVQSGQTV